MVIRREEQESLRGLPKADLCSLLSPQVPRQGPARSVLVKWTLVWESINIALAVIIIKIHFSPL